MTHPPTSNKRARGGGNNAANGNAQNVDDDDDMSLSSTIPPPDGGWGWMVVLGSFLISVIADGLTYSFGIFINEFTHYFKSGSGATAWIASILVGVTLCSGALLAGFCLSISVFATNVSFLYVTVGFGTGLGFGLIYLPSIVSVTCYFEKLRSLATGIAVCGSGLGTFLFAPLTEWLISEYGWRGALLIFAGIVFHCIIFGALFRPLPEKPKKNLETPENEKKEIEMNTLDSKKAKNGDVLKADWRHSVCNGSDMPEASENWALTNGLLAPPVKVNSSSAHDVSRPPPPTRFLRSETARMAMSHPAQLNHSPVVQQKTRTQRPHSLVLSRPDVFYRGSLANIPLYRSTPRLQQDAERAGSNQVDSPALSRSASRDASKKADEAHGSSHDDQCCGGNVSSNMMKEMLDVSLLKDPIFVLFTASNFCTSIGFNIPYVYIVAQAEQLGIPSDKASLLLSVIGGANTFGRIILGYLSDKPCVNRLIVYNVCLTICGIATMASIFCTNFALLVVYCCIFGFTIGAYVGLTSVILVDLLGLEVLTNAFGWLYDALLSYDPGFLVAGVAIAASGIMLFFIPPLQRFLARRNISRTTKINAS
ncbi:hypothetical protein B566_EDAN014747 [Ephemera danica]|nr:hypothetical protein B566_EDAN014747 [Ephemera danica]